MQTVTENSVHLKLNLYQSRFYESICRYPALVSGWGTGKTMTLIFKILKHCQQYPNNLSVIFRKEFTDLRDSTIKDFENYTGNKVSSSRDFTLPNGSAIMFRHTEELNNLQNINLGSFGIEQGDELDSDEQFFMLTGRLRRAGMPHFGAVIANTKGHNWIYKNWKCKMLKDSELYEAVTFDNQDNLPRDYVSSLEILKTSKPKMYNRFVMNSWEDSDTTDIVIHPDWVQKAVDRIIFTEPPIRMVVSIAVARFGDDKTMFYAFENYKVIGKEEHEKKDTMETTGLAQLFAKKHKDIQWFAVDEIGVGAGVADRLKELGKNVIMVNSAKRSNEPEKYYNLRSEIYAKGAEALEFGKVQIMPNDSDLIEQLSWAKYKAINSNGLLQIEAKDDIKKRFGRSPDNADAFLNGLWALAYTQVVLQKDREEDKGGWKDGDYVNVRPIRRQRIVMV